MRVLALLLFVAAALPVPAAAQYAAERGPAITVRGEGIVEMKPELARFSVTLRTAGDTLKATTDAHKAKGTQAAAALARIGEGAAVRSSSFALAEESVDPDRLTSRSKRRYEATTVYRLEVSRMDRLDAVLNGLIDSGTFELHQLVFAVADPRAAVNTARKAAVADARVRAEGLAEAAGVALGEVLVITDDEEYPHADGVEADLPQGGQVQIIPPATLSFEGSVRMTWRIAPR
jgi:uncharacterized protein YggE